MLNKYLAALLVSVMSCLNCFGQVASPATGEKVNAEVKLSRAYFYKVESPKFDFEKESLKTQAKKNNFSGGAKTALIVGLFAAGVIAVVLLTTRDKKETSSSPCGVGVSQVGIPCPPGCVCIQ